MVARVVMTRSQQSQRQIITETDLYGEKVTWKAPDGLNTTLYKVFERYSVRNKAMLCLYRNGQVNTAIREDSKILELQDRLKEWLEQN